MSLKKVSLSEVSEFVKLYQIDVNLIFEQIVLDKIQKKWNEIIGPILAKNIIPIQFSKGKLTLSISHPAYSQEGRFIQEKILKDVNSMFNEKVLEKIYFSSKTTFIKNRAKKNKLKDNKVK